MKEVHLLFALSFLLLISLSSSQWQPKGEEFEEDSGPAPPSSPSPSNSNTPGVLLNKPHSPDDMEPADSNVPEEEKSKDPNGSQEEPKTGSPFDFLNDHLDQEEDLSKTKAALDSPEAKELIDKYGENLTIFAPNDDAFAQEKEPDDEESKANFLANHVVVGQRVPVYPPSSPPSKDESNKPKVLRANILISGGPLVHVIDRLNRRPIDSAALCDLQPAMTAMMQILTSVNMRKILNQRSTFFCPSNEAMSNVGAGGDPEVVKRFIADHLIPGTSGGCTGRPYLNGNGRPVSCYEGRSSIILNGRILPKRKVPTIRGMVFIIPSLAVDDAEYLPQLLNSGKPIRISIQLDDDPKSKVALPPPSNIRLRELRQPQPPFPSVLESLSMPESNDVIPRNLLKPLLKNLRDALPPKTTTPTPEDPETPEDESPPPENPEDPEDQPPPPPSKPKTKKPKQKPKPADEPEEDTPTEGPQEEQSEKEQPEDEPKPKSSKPKKPTLEDTPTDDQPKPDEPTSPEEPQEDTPTEAPPEEQPEEQPDEPEKPETPSPENTQTDEPESPSPEEETPEEPPQPSSPKSPKPKKPKQKPPPTPPEDDEPEKPEEDQPEDEPKQKSPKPKKPTTPSPEEPPTDEEPTPPPEEDQPKPDEPESSPEDSPPEENPETPLPDEPQSDEPPADEQLRPPSKSPKPKTPKQKPTPSPPEEPESPPEETPDEPPTPEEQPPKSSKPKKPKQKPTPKPDDESQEDSPPEPEEPKPEEEQPEDEPKPKSPKLKKPTTPSPEETPTDEEPPPEEETPPEEQPPEKAPEEEPPQPKSKPKPKKPKQKPTPPPPEEPESLPEEAPEEPEEEPPKPPKPPKSAKPKAKKPKQKPSPPDEPESPPEDEEQQVPAPSESCPNPPCDFPPEQPPSPSESCPNPPCDYPPEQTPPSSPQPSESCPNPPCDQTQEQPEPEPERIEQTPESENEPYMPPFEPSAQVSLPRRPSPNQIRSAMQQSAKKLNCGRFMDWLVNSGVLDDLMKRFKGRNCTVFLPIDSASSKLPFNMLQSMNSSPKKQKKLMQLHTVPAPFSRIYPSNTPRSSFSPVSPVPSTSQEPLRFDRSLLRSPNTGQYVPLISGCPMLDSHQVGPVRMVSLGSVLFPPQPNLYSVLKRSPNLKYCREIVDQSGLGPAMADPSQTYTMFMPSDQAIQKRYSPRQLSSMVRDPNACRDFVKKHLIRDRSVYTNSIPITQEQQLDASFRGRSVEMNSAAEDPLRIKRTSQSLYVNGAHSSYSDISCNNGVAHIMNDMF